MKASAIQKSDWQGVFAVPTLARHRDAARSINWQASSKIAAHIPTGGVTRLLYCGNFFPHRDAPSLWRPARRQRHGSRIN